MQEDIMFKPSAMFSGFSVNDMAKAKEFYGKTLGLAFKDDMGGTRLQLPNASEVWIYQKDDHQPATYTMLNFIVDNIDAALDELLQSGIVFEQYPGLPQDEKGVMRGKSKNMGPNIAWFKDPAENILAVVEV
jgi:catechol 2,3-dioxygenase-like lactoylglutathione lyase family enzyme